METTTLKIRQHLNSVSSRPSRSQSGRLPKSQKRSARPFVLKTKWAFFLEFTLLYTEFGRPVLTREERPYQLATTPTSVSPHHSTLTVAQHKDYPEKGKRRVWGRWFNCGKMASRQLPWFFLGKKKGKAKIRMLFLQDIQTYNRPPPTSPTQPLCFVGTLFRTGNKILHLQRSIDRVFFIYKRRHKFFND